MNQSLYILLILSLRNITEFFEIDSNISSISFTDSLNGWAAGGHGGLTWDTEKICMETLEKIYFIDNKKGLLVGSLTGCCSMWTIFHLFIPRNYNWGF